MSIKSLTLDSNSPLRPVPANTLDIFSENIILSFRKSTTSPWAIFRASPSTTADLPTPGSPIRIGLFFILLVRISDNLSTSSSIPITGSILPSLALLVRSIPYLSMRSPIFSLNRSLVSTSFSLFTRYSSHFSCLRPTFSRICLLVVFSRSKKARNRWLVVIFSAYLFLAFSLASSKARW